jgi:hypothetical protein
MRRKYQVTRNRVQLHNRLESLLEEAHIKLSSLVSDLLGTSARRMLQALADGETDLHPVYRRLVTLTLEELRMVEDHLGQLDQQMAALLSHHHDAVHRLAEVPGLGVGSAQQIIAEVGAAAATFPSAKHLASWMGACPGPEESAGKNYSHRCPKGNRQMRRVLNQAANAAVKATGTLFAIVYRRLVPQLGHAQAIGAITHRLCRLIWKILHQGIRYEERGPAVVRCTQNDASERELDRHAPGRGESRTATSRSEPSSSKYPSVSEREGRIDRRQRRAEENAALNARHDRRAHHDRQYFRQQPLHDRVAPILAKQQRLRRELKPVERAHVGFPQLLDAS